MSLRKFFTFFLSILISFTSVSCSNFNEEKIKIALVLSGPVKDSYKNEAAYNGLKRFQSDYKTEIAVVERVNQDDAKDIFSGLAERKYDLVIANDYDFGPVLKNIVKMFPDTSFSVIEGHLKEEPNLSSFNFKSEQIGYLTGVVAGLNTATNKTGIVVGKKSPSTKKTILGFRKGLRDVNPKADLTVSYIDSNSDITKGREAAASQINTGVDVIAHLAEQSGVGVIKACEEADISAIGSVVDQHDLAPSTVITSYIEDVSQLIYLACEYFAEKKLQPRIYTFGLKDQIIDLASSYGNIDPTVETKMNRIKSQLLDIEIAEQEQLKNKSKKSE